MHTQVSVHSTGLLQAQRLTQLRYAHRIRDAYIFDSYYVWSARPCSAMSSTKTHLVKESEGETSACANSLPLSASRYTSWIS